MSRLLAAGLIIALGFVLMSCATPVTPASVYQGECRVFTDPGFRVKGLTTKDNRWIATTQEKGIQVCRWQRPPSMPDPTPVKADVIDCATVHQVVRLFGGDVARAEAYAVGQGASVEQIAAARACLAAPAVVKVPGLGARHRMTRKQQGRFLGGKPPVVETSVPVSAPASVAVPTPPVASPVPVAAPVARKKCKPRNYRWQYWRPKVCP